MSYKVFISYSTKDLSLVERVKSILDNDTINVFIAEHSILPGESLRSEIMDNIKSCDLFILLWSKNSQKSEWVQQEIGIATSVKKPIIPIFLSKKLKAPAFLKDIKYLSFHDNPEKALAMLKENVFSLAEKKSQQEGLVWLSIGIAVLFLIGRG